MHTDSLETCILVIGHVVLRLCYKHNFFEASCNWSWILKYYWFWKLMVILEKIIYKRKSFFFIFLCCRSYKMWNVLYFSQRSPWLLFAGIGTQCVSHSQPLSCFFTFLREHRRHWRKEYSIFRITKKQCSHIWL